MAATAPEDLYEADFYAWTQLQARALRRLADTRPNLPLDLAHLTEEIRDLGKEQRNALRSWTTRIIEHLLLLQHSAATEPRRGWIGEIVDFRSEIEDRLTPTLRRDLQRQLPVLYDRATAEPAAQAGGTWRDGRARAAGGVPIRARPTPVRLVARRYALISRG